jgi:hypothetical protein
MYQTKRLAFRAYAFGYWIVAGLNTPRLIPHRLRKVLHVGDGATESSSGAAVAARRPLAGVAGLPRTIQQVLRHKWLATDQYRANDSVRIRLHTNASGDFTLMSKADWLKAGGYAEFEMYSMHIDGLLLYEAHYFGIRERFLPFPVYHIEHGGGFRPEAKGDDSLDATLAERAIPQITNEQLMDYIRAMFDRRAPLRPNGEDWGFAAIEFVETRPQQASTFASSTADRGTE